MAYTVHLLAERSDIEGIRPQWERLWARSDHAGYGLTPAACMSAFNRMLGPQGARLVVAAGYDDGELVALWPLSVRRRGLWRFVNQAGPLAAEYSNILVEPGPQAAARVTALWQAVERANLADVAVVPFLRDGALGSLLAAHPRLMSRDTDIAPHLAWREGETWDAYYASLDGSYRRGQNRRRRQLDELGAVQFEVVTDSVRAPQIVAWLLAEKRQWADRTDKRGAWVFSPAYEAFVTELVTQAAGFVVFALTLDQAPVAAKFALIGPRRVEFIISGYLAALGRFSPGNILNEHCLRHAHERNLAVEFGAGKEETKKYWSRGTADVTGNYRVALTRWGLTADFAQRGLAHVRAARRGLRQRANTGATVGASVAVAEARNAAIEPRSPEPRPSARPEWTSDANRPTATT